MLKKNYIAIIIIILLLTGGVFTYLIMSNMQEEKAQQIEDRGLADILPEIQCNFSADKDAFKEAVEAKNLGYCGCIENEKVKENCETSVSDSISFDQAVAQYNLDLCKNISSVEHRESCVSLVSKSIARLETQSPLELAVFYGQTGNYQGAIEIFQSEVAKNPEDVDALLGLAIAYANYALETRQEEEFIPLAEEAVNKALAINSQNPEAYRVQGFVFEVKPDSWNQAIESYQKSIEIDPNYILAYVGLGHTYNLIGDLPRSMEFFLKAKDLDSSRQQSTIYSNLCRLQSSNSDMFEEAVENCKIAANLEETYVESKIIAHGTLAELYKRVGNIEEAMRQVKLAMNYSYDNVNLYTQLAQLENMDGKYEEAETSARKALSLDEMKTLAYDALAYALYKQGSLEEAEKYALQGVDVVGSDISLLDPEKPTTRKNLYYVLANIYNAQGDSAKENNYKQLAEEL